MESLKCMFLFVRKNSKMLIVGHPKSLHSFLKSLSGFPTRLPSFHKNLPGFPNVTKFPKKLLGFPTGKWKPTWVSW